MYLYSKNKVLISCVEGADQLRGCCAGDLRLCFCICKKHVLSCYSSYVSCFVCMFFDSFHLLHVFSNI